jgi:hypothetical protein
MSISGYVSLAEAKDQTSVDQDFDGHDATLTRLIAAAEQWAVNFLNIESLDDLVVDEEESPQTIPEVVTSAILMMVAHWFENREAINVGNIVTQIPYGVETMLWPYRQGLGV